MNVASTEPEGESDGHESAYCSPNCRRLPELAYRHPDRSRKLRCWLPRHGYKSRLESSADAECWRRRGHPCWAACESPGFPRLSYYRELHKTLHRTRRESFLSSDWRS